MQKGLTLIEVLIVMVVVAILAAIAVPSYTQYILRGHRAEARAQLMSIAQWQERFRTENNRFAAAANVPASLTSLPSSNATRYVITVNTAADGSTYTLTATRAGSQSSDACGDLTLTNTGARGIANSTRTVAECWGR